MNGLRVIDISTGEDKTSENTIVNRKSAESYKRILAQGDNGRQETFFFNRISNLNIAMDALTTAQCGFLLMLSSYIVYNGLIVKSENDPTPMTTKGMQQVLRVTKTRQSTFYDFLNACITNDIITAGKDGRYYVNERFHFRGRTDGERVVMTMIHRLRRMYAEVGAHDIGLLYRLIPYIHIDSNILCANPEEKSARHVRKFNRKEAAEAAGVQPSLISRAASRMVFRKKSVFARITTATDGTFYMINPSVLRRSNVDYDVTVTTVFGLDS